MILNKLISPRRKIKFVLKAVVIGDGMVGKTSLCKRFLKKVFESDYKKTIGADFYVYEQGDYISELDLEIDVKWIIYDLAGQFVTYYEVRPLFYRGAKAALVVFDVARPETFKSIPAWIHEFWKHASERGIIERRPLVIVGNKIDLREKVSNSVPAEKGMEYAKKLSSILGFEVPYVETSALLDLGVDKAFKSLLITVLRYYGVFDRLRNIRNNG